MRTYFFLACLLAAQSQAACVSGRYQADAQGIQDKDSGLVWARCSVGQQGPACKGTARAMTYDEAVKYAQTQPGWRLPTHDELMTLVQSKCSDLHINTQKFPNTPATATWSATTSDNSGSGIWVVDLREGFDEIVNKSNSKIVRLVRGHGKAH